jgi:uncharacterized protein (DUF1778 family)
MAADIINIRVESARKKALQEVAKACHESLSEFLLNAGFERAKVIAKEGVKEDPFVVAMREAAAKAPKAVLDAEDLKAIAASRKARARGEKGLTVTEAMKAIRGEAVPALAVVSLEQLQKAHRLAGKAQKSGVRGKAPHSRRGRALAA